MKVKKKLISTLLVLLLIFPTIVNVNAFSFNRLNIYDEIKYIEENLNNNYIHKNKTPEIYNAIHVVNTFADSSLLQENTINNLWQVDEDNDGYADNAGAYLGQNEGYLPLYSFSEDDEYVVGKINVVDDPQFKFSGDYIVAHDNNFAQIIKDVIYEEETGLVYVPKKYRGLNENNELLLGDIKIQLLYVIEDYFNNYVENNQNITVNGQDFKVDTILDNSVTIDLQEQGISENIEELYINGLKEENYKIYEEKYLTIYCPATFIDTIQVKTRSGFKDLILNLFGTKEVDAAWEISREGPIIFAREPELGDMFELAVTEGTHIQDGTTLSNGFAYWQISDDPNVIDDFFNIYHTVSHSFESGDSQYLSSIIGMLNGTLRVGESTNVHRSYDNALTWLIRVPAGRNAKTTKGNTVKLKNNFNTLLNCSHNGVSLDFKVGNYNMHSPELIQLAGQGKMKIHFTVVGKTNGYVHLALCTPTMNTQVGSGYIKMAWETEGCDTYVKKGSTESYKPSVQGIKYGIYTSQANAQNNGTLAKDIDGNNAILTIGADGWSNKIKMNPGTYWVKERETNNNYVLSTEIKQIVVNATNGTNVKTDSQGNRYCYVEFNDIPAYQAVQINKTVDREDTKSNYPITNAEFTFYSNSSYTTVAKDINGNNAMVKVNENGLSPIINLPPGTYYVRETGVPEHYYKAEDQSFVVETKKQNKTPNILTFKNILHPGLGKTTKEY